ncbi:phosphate/phosphite/phosphonate ABC transporter substrate-binding protein [Terrilactibacillus laevilacticus]|uniref:Phosphate/phosphite/phosphonate ABC transporter substrate-binding protein n=1 Tax=Terrilactibacillus laevilacticus TaxID=1380157 RepID=A0ABW5PNC9_9BACI|nr:phosphate/phosphite/phosphonate ABC transporter substrate-binding protein [Terrilactibacillus laevilacticus]
MVKKIVLLFAALSLIIGVLSGCGSKSSGGSKDYVPKKLLIGFVPSSNADTLEARAKPLAKLLQKRLGIPVKVTVTTDYNSIVEAMGHNKMDIGFLPPTDYVLAHDKGYADVLLQAERFGVNPKDGKSTNEKVDYYYSGMLVRNDSGIKSIKDLKGKKIGWQDTTSTAGYVFPAVTMKKAGIDPQKDVTGVTLQGHDKGVLAVLNKDVDAAPVFVDARNIVAAEYPNVFKDTHYIFQTAKIPNDTISVRPDMSSKWKKKISDAFVDIGNDPEGNKIIMSIYTHSGYAKSKDSNFDIVRDYNKKIQEVGK